MRCKQKIPTTTKKTYNAAGCRTLTIFNHKHFILSFPFLVARSASSSVTHPHTWKNKRSYHSLSNRSNRAPILRSDDGVRSAAEAAAKRVVPDFLFTTCTTSKEESHSAFPLIYAAFQLFTTCHIWS